MMYPTIHLGGTHPKDLLEEQVKVINSLRDAIAAMQVSGPNGRDYHPQGPRAINSALEEHEQRILVLRNVLAEQEALAWHIAQHLK